MLYKRYQNIILFPLLVKMMDNIKLFVAPRKTRGDYEKMRCYNDGNSECNKILMPNLSMKCV